MQENFRRVERASENFEESTENLSNSINDFSAVMRESVRELQSFTNANNKAEKSTSSFGDFLSAGILVDGLSAIASSMLEVVENSQELNDDLSRLRANANDVGSDIGLMEEHFKKLSAITGETDSTVEGLSNLLRTGFNDSDLTEIIESLSGAIIAFPDTLKIESLADGLQETLATGNPMGQFAELLDRTGIGADNFKTQLESLSTEAERQQLVLQTLSQTGLAELSQSYNEANSSMLSYKEAQIELDMALANFSNATLPLLANGLSVIANFATRLSTAFTSDGIQGFATEFQTIISELVNNLISNLPNIFNFGIDFINTLNQGIVNAIPQISQAAIELINGLSTFLKSNLPTIIQTGLEYSQKFASSLRENAGLLIDAAINLAQNLADGLISSIPSIVKNVPEIVSNIAGVINDNAPKLLKAGLSLIIQLVKGLIENIPIIIQNLPKIINAIIDTIFAFNWINLGKSIIELIVKGLRGLLNLLTNSGKDIINAIKEGFTGLSDKLVQIGKDIVKGIWEGIKSMGNWLKEKVISIGQSIVSSFKDFFNIHSPSRLMRDEVGLMIGQGIGIGLDKSESFVVKSTDNISNAIINTINKKNFEIEKIEEEAQKRQAQKVEQQKKEQMQKLYDKLEKAEIEEKQSIQDEINALEETWNEERIIKQEQAEKEILNKEIKGLKEIQKQYESTINTVKQEYEALMNTVKQEYEAAVNEVVRQQESLSGKLADFGSLFEKTEEGIILSNIEDDINSIEQYGEAIEKLKKKNISESLMSEIMSMDVETANQYMTELLKLTDEDFNNYNNLWEEKQLKAKEIAEEFYQDQLQTLEEDFTNRLSEQLQEVPNTMENIGQDSIQGWIDGVNSKLGIAVDVAKKLARETISAMKSEMGLNGDIYSKNLEKTISNTNFNEIVRNAMPQFQGAVISTLSGITPRLAYNTGISTNNNTTTYNDGDFILKIGTVNNAGSSSIKNILSEAEFYRKQTASSRGGR